MWLVKAWNGFNAFFFYFLNFYLKKRPKGGEKIKNKAVVLQGYKIKSQYIYIWSTLSHIMYTGVVHFCQYLLQFFESSFGLKVSLSIQWISFIIPIHWVLVGGSTWNHFWVIAFLLLTKSIWIKYLSIVVTINFWYFPRYNVIID